MTTISKAEMRYTILIHGGTVMDAGQVSDGQLALIRHIVIIGRDKLVQGSNAIDVAVDSIIQMEDSGLFDAGKGSHLNKAGFVENDAALMDGNRGRAGSVALLRRIKNPIHAARITMDQTSHVMLAGSTGEESLIKLGAEIVDDPASYFVPASRLRDEKPDLTGTVGAVVLDRHGRLVAGTSTGGTREKLPGRISDSAIVGAGTFASQRFAVSATGVGEYFILRSAAHDIAMRCEYLGMSLQAAADFVVHDLIGAIDKAPGAVIAISRDGEIVLSSNVYGIIHGYASDSMEVTVGERLNR